MLNRDKYGKLNIHLLHCTTDDEYNENSYAITEFAVVENLHQHDNLKNTLAPAAYTPLVMSGKLFLIPISSFLGFRT